MMFSALIAVALATNSEPGDPGPQRWNSQRSPEHFRDRQQRASVACARSRLPDECWAASIASDYSQLNLMMCWERAGEQFPYGGTQAPGVRDEMRQTCRQAIGMCRDNHQRSLELSGWLETWPNGQRQEILRQNLRDYCDEEVSDNAANQ